MKTKYVLPLFVLVLTVVQPLSCDAQFALQSRLINGALELSWQVSSNFDSQLLTSDSLKRPVTWTAFDAPLAAPLLDGWVTNAISGPSLNSRMQFFQIRYNSLSNCPVPTVPGRYSLCFQSGRLERTYRLMIPASYAGQPSPLGFFVHGHDQTAVSFENLHPELESLAQIAGMILIFPQSTENPRGTGWVNYDAQSGEPYVDDAQFILDLLEYVALTLNIDRQRVYVGGFSNGGQMVHYLASRTTNTFAAYAAVGASDGGARDGTNIIYISSPQEARSILIVNATNDCKRPFWGGTNSDGIIQPSSIDAAYRWTTNNVCMNAPVVVTNYFVLNSTNRPNYPFDCPDLHPPPNVPLTNLIITTTWLGCTSWTEVAFVQLSDGGHLWPDAPDYVGYDASSEVMAFFQRHCRCDHPGSLVVPTTPGIRELAVCDQGYWRKFRLQIPSTYTGAMPFPLGFICHGGGQDIASFSALHPDLFLDYNARQVILVLPEATEHPQPQYRLWGDKPISVVVDDRAFITNLLETLDATLNVDRLRVYASGFSNGGDFSYLLGGTTAGIFAAIGVVCGAQGYFDPLGMVIVPPAPLPGPMPALIVRGGVDPIRPWLGNATTFSAMQDFNFWRGPDGNNCPFAPVFTAAGPLDTWDACPGAASARQVTLIRVNPMGHEWPDAASGVGYDANAQVIDWLLMHP